MHTHIHTEIFKDLSPIMWLWDLVNLKYIEQACRLEIKGRRDVSVLSLKFAAGNSGFLGCSLEAQLLLQEASVFTLRASNDWIR